MEEKPKPYQPYTPMNEKGSNDVKENTGAGATEPYRPNGWGEQFESNTFDTAREGK